MPEIPCTKSDGYFVLRDGAAGLFMASSNYPRSRETRNPLVKELYDHCDELDPKHRYLAEAPLEDPDGNPTIIRWSRNDKAQYVMTEIVKNDKAKATGWQAHYVNGRWEVKSAEPKEKAAAKK